MRGASRLGLGTAQFGLDYGITNRRGHVGAEEARRILERAAAAGIDTLDTARLYGGSEAAIGRAAPAGAHFRIVTKTPKFAGLDDAGAAASLRSAFEQSLASLGASNVYALLVHDAADLLGPAAPGIWGELERLRAAGLATKIGVSVYDGAEIDRSMARFALDVVQLPFNALDPRLLDGGQLDRLAAAGVEVHARSLFLQGLLLERAERIPPRFGPVREAVEMLDREFGAAGFTRLEGLLALAFARRGIHRFICGVTSAEELDAIVLAAERARRVEGLQVPTLPEIDARLLNPARWGELGD